MLAFLLLFILLAIGVAVYFTLTKNSPKIEGKYKDYTDPLYEDPNSSKNDSQQKQNTSNEDQ